MVVNGNLVSGTSGAAGEVGHIKLIKNGKLCGCGQKGCWEAYASATGLIREAKSRLAVNRENLLWESLNGNLESLEAKHVFDAAKNGDAFSKDLVAYEVEYLAFGLSALINTLNPEVVVVGGGVSLAGDILFGPLKEELKKYTLPGSLEKIEIKAASLGNEAGIIGGAALAASKQD
jgi:glucokinase